MIGIYNTSYEYCLMKSNFCLQQCVRLTDVLNKNSLSHQFLSFVSPKSPTKITFAVAFSTVTPHIKITESTEHRSEDELTPNSTSFEYTSSFGETENYLIPKLPDYSNLNSKYQSYVSILNILELNYIYDKMQSCIVSIFS